MRVLNAVLLFPLVGSLFLVCHCGPSTGIMFLSLPAGLLLFVSYCWSDTVCLLTVGLLSFVSYCWSDIVCFLLLISYFKIRLFYVAWRTSQGLYQLLKKVNAGWT